MVRLDVNESRVLGVLVEKALTTPGQYPLSLNALVTGCNQKNNREPVMHLSEDDVLEAIDGLRPKGLLREVMMSGSRVTKYRHVAREVLELESAALVVMIELLLRGPQTPSELRSRASRMHQIDSPEELNAILDDLRSRPEPMIRDAPPVPGGRAARVAQLICPDLHPIDAAPAAAPAAARQSAAAPAAAPADPAIEGRVAALEAEVRSLRDEVARLRAWAEADKGPLSGPG